MQGISETLSSFPFFRSISVLELRATQDLWSHAILRPGQVLWEQGAAVHELALVVTGELAALVDEQVEIGRVTPGEMAGEASVFLAGATRSATLRAVGPTQVLRLPVGGLRLLRQKRSDVYFALLDQALATLARRVRITDKQIAQLTRGTTTAPVRTEPSALVRLWKALRPGGPSSPCPGLEPLLRRQPGLKQAPDDVIETLAGAFSAVAVEEGQVLFLEGEPGAAAYLVAEGEIDVLRHVRGDRAELLATLRPGDQFGINTLVENGSRTASCVASTAAWLYKMEASSFAQLQGEARLHWNENVLAALASQIRNANAALQRAMSTTSLGNVPPALAAAARKEAPAKPKRSASSGGDQAFEQLLKASGYLEGHSVSDADLGKVRVVFNEDQKRKLKGPSRN